MHKSVREDFLHCFNHNFTNPQRFDADYQEHELLAPDRALVNAKDLVSSEKGNALSQWN